MTNKMKLTFVVPEVLQDEMRQRIIKEGYGMRGKSLWVAEAIERLLALSNFPELVLISDELKHLQKVETIAINKELRARLEAAIVTIRKAYPTVEGVQSRIIRTSILQRLLRA